MFPLLPIGKILSAHGLKGEVTIALNVKDANIINNWNAIMLELNSGSYIPYFIETARVIDGNQVLCKLEDINNPEQAKLLSGITVYNSPYIKVDTVVNTDWDSFTGFTLINSAKQTIGTITSVIEIKKQPYWQLQVSDKDMMIPIIEDWVVDVQPNKKVIIINLPDGYMEAFS